MDMEYVVGSVADLISGNLTPSRPSNLNRARTPMKHQPSPHVTPRSETPLNGREAILSPSVLRKKAVAKKSPKRIFEKEDLDKTAEGVVTSPKADKAKKHLQAALEETEEKIKNPKRKLEHEVNREPVVDELISKKKKKNKKSKQYNEELNEKEETIQKSPKESKDKKATGKKRRKRNKKAKQNNILQENMKTNTVQKFKEENIKTDTVIEENNNASVKKNKKKKKAKKNQTEGAKTDSKESRVKKEDNNDVPVESNLSKRTGKNKKNKNKKKEIKYSKISESVNSKEASGENTDSEHDSDNEIESETEQDVKHILDNGSINDEDSSDEEEENKKSKTNKPDKKKEKEETSKEDDPFLTAEETKRTLFVGNVPMSKRCKKEIKQIFNKYGTIESIRIRAVPVKDLRTNPKVAAITNQIHPDRTSVNVYVKFSNVSSMTEALAENNCVIGKHHLRVTRAESRSVVHDPRKTIFIGNIPFGIEDDTLRAKFEKCGAIESVRIIRDRALQIGKGFGYVNFASTDGVELALSLTEDDLAIKNRILRVRRYTVAPPGQKVKGKGPNQFNRGQHQGNRGFQGNRDQGNRGFQGNRDQVSRGFQGSRDQGNRGFQGNRDQGNTLRQGNKGFQGNRDQENSNDWNKDKFNSKPRDESGALRRLNKKREFQDNSFPNTGPPQKKQKTLDQPKKEKKQKKEFVGMTAEKKKKKKLDKGSKRKQKLSEILTKR